jgi:hypothetical protein
LPPTCADHTAAAAGPQGVERLNDGLVHKNLELSTEPHSIPPFPRAVLSRRGRRQRRRDASPAPRRCR